jgi:hypothetical protein
LVATLTVYPGIRPNGTRVTVLAQDGVTPIPTTGAVVPYNDYYAPLLNRQVLLDYDPVNSGGPPVSLLVPAVVVQDAPQPGETLVATSATTASWSTAPGGNGVAVVQSSLSSPGSLSRELKPTFLSTDFDAFGEWAWKPGDSTATNAWECIAATGGRWRRIWSREIDVRWFGARGGAYAGPSGHGDTDAIQAAINAAAEVNADLVAWGATPGVTVRLQPTVYIVSDKGSGNAWKLLLKSNVSIAGSGPCSVIRSALGRGAFARTLSSENGVTLRNVTLKDFAIDGVESAQPLAGNYQRASVFIYNCEDITVDNLDIKDSCDVLRFFGPTCSRVRVINNRLHDCEVDIGREVVQGEGMRDSIVSGNHIWNCPYATGIKMENAPHGLNTNNVISDNVIESVGAGIYLVGEGVTISNNRIKDCTAAPGMQVQGDALIVCNEIDGCYTAGIYMATIGASGARVHISKNIIRNVNGDVPGFGSSAPFGVLGGSSGAFSSGHISVEDNTIEAFLGSLAGGAYGVRLDQVTGPVHVRGNMLMDVGRGVSVAPPTTAALKSVKISDNTIRLSTNGIGVLFGGGSSPALLTRVSITMNTMFPAASATGTTGIRHEGITTGVVIIGNDADECATPYIAVNPITDLVLDNNLGF